MSQAKKTTPTPQPEDDAMAPGFSVWMARENGTDRKPHSSHDTLAAARQAVAAFRRHTKELPSKVRLEIRDPGNHHVEYDPPEKAIAIATTPSAPPKRPPGSRRPH